MLLSRDEIEKSISFYGWEWGENAIHKTFNFDKYTDGVDFVNSIAEISETMNHHADIFLEFCCVKISISSHDLGGVSTKCINLATKIDQVNVI
tara:strand:- start:693 stop:971 length:279 start_codon:yes stop_codon:yes gene_type:complete